MIHFNIFLESYLLVKALEFPDLDWVIMYLVTDSGFLIHGFMQYLVCSILQVQILFFYSQIVWMISEPGIQLHLLMNEFTLELLINGNLWPINGIQWRARHSAKQVKLAGIRNARDRTGPFKGPRKECRKTPFMIKNKNNKKCRNIVL